MHREPSPPRARRWLGSADEEAALTMTAHLQRLLTVGGSALLPECAAVDLSELTTQWRGLAGALTELLTEKNGFYAFESSLLVRTLKYGGLPLGVLQWNEASLWKQDYSDGMLDRLLCFAEDAFGNQFALDGSGIVAVDSETGKPEHIASSVDEWAKVVLEDYNYRTGYPL